MEIKKVLKNEKGEMLYLWLIGILMFLLLFAGMMEILRIRQEARQIRYSVEKEIVAEITNKWKEVYTGVREGYSAAYSYEESTNKWKKMLSGISVISAVKKSLGLDASGRKPANTKQGYLYQVKEIKIHVVEISLLEKEKILEAKGEIIVNMAFSPWGSTFEMTIPIAAKYQKLF